MQFLKPPESGVTNFVIEKNQGSKLDSSFNSISEEDEDLDCMSAVNTDPETFKCLKAFELVNEDWFRNLVWILENGKEFSLLTRWKYRKQKVP